MFKPLSNRVFIKPLKDEKTTESGIILPDSAEKEPVKGEVVAVGPGKLNNKGERSIMSVKVGDKILFREYGPEIEFKGQKYLIRDEDEILAILEE